MKKTISESAGGRGGALRLLSCLIILVSVGCGGGLDEKPTWDPFKLVWPLPPERPRIKYVDTLMGEEDVFKAKSISQSIFGEEKLTRLRKPYGVTTDEKGRVFVSDVGAVFVFDKAESKFSIIGGSGIAKLVRPLGIFYEKQSGLLYVSDSNLDRVFAFRADGEAIMEIGGKGELKDPGGLVVDSERKRIYVANTKNHVISVFGTDGMFIKNIGQRGTDPGSFNFPTQLAIGKNGRLYVVDSGNFRIQILDSEGNFVKQMGSVGDQYGQFARPKGIGIDPVNDLLYVTDATWHGVTVFDAEDGILLFTWGARGWLKGLIELPSAVHVDERGRVYVVSQSVGKVDIFQFVSYPNDQEELQKARETRRAKEAEEKAAEEKKKAAQQPAAEQKPAVEQKN